MNSRSFSSVALIIGGWSLVAVAGASACARERTVLTPQERLDQEERLAYEAEQKKKQRGDDKFVPVEEEKKEFDEEQSTRELKRATRSAETCTGVVETKQYGDTEVTITFEEAGVVKEATIPPPYAGTPLGSCVLRAFQAVIVPPYQGGDKTMTWKVSLKPPTKDGATANKKK